jgi:hypothetical protein
MDFIYAGFGLKLTTEAQRPRRKVVFPWPGDDGQGKETAGFAGKAVVLEGGNKEAGALVWNSVSFYVRTERAVRRTELFLSDRRLPIGQNKSCSVLSVPLWLIKIELSGSLWIN